MKELKESGQKIALTGDGKFDSPGKGTLYLILQTPAQIISGFSASFCTYAVQSIATKKIIAIWVAAKHVVRKLSSKLI